MSCPSVFIDITVDYLIQILAVNNSSSGTSMPFSNNIPTNVAARASKRVIRSEVCTNAPDIPRPGGTGAREKVAGGVAATAAAGGVAGRGGGNVITTALVILFFLIVVTHHSKTNVLKMLLKEDIRQTEVLWILLDSIIT